MGHIQRGGSLSKACRNLNREILVGWFRGVGELGVVWSSVNYGSDILREVEGIAAIGERGARKDADGESNICRARKRVLCRIKIIKGENKCL